MILSSDDMMPLFPAVATYILILILLRYGYYNAIIIDIIDYYDVIITYYIHIIIIIDAHDIGCISRLIIAWQLLATLCHYATIDAMPQPLRWLLATQLAIALMKAFITLFVIIGHWYADTVITGYWVADTADSWYWLAGHTDID